MSALPARTRFATPETFGDVARVTLSTKVRTPAPGIVRARLLLADALGVARDQVTQPRIVAQSGGEWMTWEAHIVPAETAR